MEEINKEIQGDGHGCFPWEVHEEGIACPEDHWRVYYYEGEEDSNTLAWVVDLILQANPDIKINGCVEITWDCDDECDCLTVEDNVVSFSTREWTFTKPEVVEAWKPTEKG